MNSNPLVAAYRKPSLYVTLPSNGRFYINKPTLSVDGELAIYPMTARDELITKTPDALFNGEATTALIRSCCPDIPEPNEVPVSDLMVLMLAIRTASYGKDVDVDVQCPECSHINMLSIDAQRLLSSAKGIQADSIIELPNGFRISLKPYNLRDRTLLQIQQVKQQRLIQNLISNETMSDDAKNEQFGKTFVEIAELTVNLLSNCITSVTPPEGEEVYDPDTIKEWLQNISRSDYDAIKERIEKLSASGIDTKFNAKCQSCSHEWKTTVELDMANFFEG